MGSKNIFLLITAVILFCHSLHSQILPDYKERQFTALPDSNGFPQNYLIEPTSGSINPDEYFVGPGDK